MRILVIRTDKPVAELYIYENGKKRAGLKWQAHRQLAETIHRQIDKILNKSSISVNEIDGIVCYKGPGSFTGLRIGLSVANSLAHAVNIPLAARGGGGWVQAGIDDLAAGKNDRIALPEYGAPANTTPPKK